MMISYYSLGIFILLHNFSKVATTAAAAHAHTAAATPAYTATDFILVNCGASSNLNDTSWRTWDSDNISSRLVSTASNMRLSVSKVPYEVASFFQSRFTYTFPLQTAGTKFLRLHFHPGIYSNFDTSQSFFSVTANGYTLLSNFSAYLYSKNSSQPSFMKEFVINIDGNKSLDLTFFPNPKSFAFVNGIEIVSCPDKLYFKGDDVPIKYEDQLFYLENSRALENLYRLNVGGGRVEIQEDSGPNLGMFRAWSPDDDYIFGADFGYSPHVEELTIKYTTQVPPYSAPPIVYTTSRVTGNNSASLKWAFPVDSGFLYLLRLHFCEIQLEVTRENQRVFTISINNHTAEIEADVVFWTGGTEIPIFKDYITWVPNDSRHGKQDLRLSLFPFLESMPQYRSTLLNGLEIFKLSDSKGSLAAANPELAIIYPPTATAAKPTWKKKNRGFSIIYSVTGSVVGIIAVVAAVIFSVSKRWRKMKHSATTSASWVLLSTTSRSTKRTRGSGVPLPTQLFRHFSLEEIKTATRKFDDNFVIGKGGFGYVYKGLINNGATTVAIKRLNPSSNQGAREFQTEIELLSKLRHLNLVSLVGYCDECGEMILVYDYMAHGTLRSHLYNTENPPLTWKQRLQICLGAAKGLDYLHSGTEQAIIHRDVKTTNILLDEKWVAKMSDFGLSKVGPIGGADAHVSTAVKGSIGYVDPEYCRRQQLTEKSDVYSFGVVLFEVLCARPAIIPYLPRERVNLAEWAKLCFTEGTVEQIIDSNLKGQIEAECLSKFAETAAACLSDKGIDRPAMSDIVWSLEFAMKLQEEAERGGGSLADGDGGSSIASSVEFESTNFELD